MSIVEKGFNKIGKLPRDIDYKYSPVFKNISTDKSGYGFTNFRVNDNVRTLQQVSEHIGPIIERDNPVETYDYMRNFNFFFNDHYKDYKMISKDEKKEANFIDIIKDFHEINPVMLAFFSKTNVDHIQKLLKAMIIQIEGPNVKISDQSEEQILMIMRSSYMNATYLDFKLKGNEFVKQISSLNKDVLDILVPRVIVGIRQYLGYAKDRSTNPYTIDRPSFQSTSGIKNFGGFADKII